MVFASGIFLFIFLPITILGDRLLRNANTKLKNIFLLLMSTFFYLESGVIPFFLLVLSIIINYVSARAIVYFRKRKGLILLFALVYNIGMLFIFKYLSFLLGEVGILFGWGLPKELLNIALPLGISFYTFQALSYVIDVYNDAGLVEYSLVNVALYISFFPQLVAGPIVRWDGIRTYLASKIRGGVDYNNGFKYFVIGLGKKVIIANQMAVFADKAYFLLDSSNLTSAFAWLGAVAYTLQIYFDFSGYSDMAIGLGKLFGFDFPQNFNYPYISGSVTEFWRRWHISLSTWFRDYVYIPLGGNRCSRKRNFVNLFIVWLLTGIWHGANYTFWIWGLIYFAVLVIEKNFEGLNIAFLEGEVFRILKSIFKHVYTMLIVIFLWVIFRSDTIGRAFEYIGHMLGKSADSEYAKAVTGLYFKNFIGYGIIAVIGCTPILNIIKNIISDKVGVKAADTLSQLFLIIVFIIACCVTIDSNYNPFIYFNF